MISEFFSTKTAFIERSKAICGLCDRNYFRNKSAGFTLIELLIVLSILSMMAGVVLPSAAVILEKSRLEAFVHRSSVLCREAFERSIFSGRKYMVQLEKSGHLTVLYFENSHWNSVNDIWLRPVKIPENCQLGWPDKGWVILPEGYCESPQVRFHDELSKETILVKIRPYDAHFIRESGRNVVEGVAP